MIPRFHHQRTHGFTLVELLVVIAIIGVLVGLLLPAVQAARESARRSSCSNNLKQLTLGMALFEQAQSCFPAGREGPDNNCPAGATDGERTSGFVHILPFIEQAPLYDIYKSKALVTPAVNTPGAFEATVFTQTPSMFGCPSFAEPLVRSGTSLGCYAICQGHFGPTYDVSNQTKCLNSGMALYYYKFKPKQITDGMSKTFFLGEVQNCYRPNNRWFRAHRHQEAIRSTDNPVNTAPGEGVVASGVNGAFGSLHPGGAMFSMVDGSVLFIQDSINLTVYRRLGQRASGASKALP